MTFCRYSIIFILLEPNQIEQIKISSLASVATVKAKQIDKNNQ